MKCYSQKLLETLNYEVNTHQNPSGSTVSGALFYLSLADISHNALQHKPGRTWSCY